MAKYTTSNALRRSSAYKSNIEKDPILWKTIDEFNSTYYSGLDVELLFGGHQMDDIIAISWVLQQMVQPIFSYADYTSRGFMRGTRQVMGQFTLNFKESSTIPALLAAITSEVTKSSDKGLVKTESGESAGTKVWATNNLTSLAGAPSGAAVHDIAAWVENNPAYIDDIAEAYDAAMFQGANTINTNVDKLTQHYGMPMYGNTVPFDIVIRYGNPGLVSKAYEAQYGSKSAVTARQGVRVGTVKRIVGCEITGVQESIDDSGRPIGETFTFYARDIDNIGEYYPKK